MEHVCKQYPQAPPHTAEVQSLCHHPWGCIWPPGEAAEGTLPRNSGFPTECSTILTCWVVCSRQLHFPAKNFPRMLYHSPCSHLSWYQWGIDCIGPSISKSLRAIIFFELQTSLTLASRKSSSLLPWLVFGFVVFHVLFILCVWMHAQWRKAHTLLQVSTEVRVSLQLAAGFCFHSEGWKQSLNSGLSALQEALCLLTGLAGPAVSFD